VSNKRQRAYLDKTARRTSIAYGIGSSSRTAGRRPYRCALARARPGASNPLQALAMSRLNFIPPPESPTFNKCGSNRSYSSFHPVSFQAAAAATGLPSSQNEILVWIGFSEQNIVGSNVTGGGFTIMTVTYPTAVTSGCMVLLSNGMECIG